MVDRTQNNEVEIRLRGYERGDHDYTKARYTLPSMKYYAQLRTNKIVGIIRRAFHSRDSLSIIDVGCGTGVLLKTLIRELGTNSYVGLDFSEQMLRNSVLDPNELTRVEMLRGSAFDLPFKDNTFDIVISTRFIHQYSDQLKKKLICEFQRVLKPGGIAIVEFYSIGPWILRYPMKMHRQRPGKYFLHCISPNRLERVLDQPCKRIPLMLPFHTFIIKSTNFRFFMRLNKLLSKLRLLFAFEQFLVVVRKS